MKRYFISLVILLFCSSSSTLADANLLWTPATIQQLQEWIDAAPSEGLCLTPNPAFIQARATNNTSHLYPAATAQALILARLHLLGCASPAQRQGWNIASHDELIDTRSLLAAALATGDLNSFFISLRPQTHDYEVLRLALRTETAPTRRATLALNMDRWRWMPHDLGRRYLIVNIPAFKVSLSENMRIVDTWRVIIGKPKTPTPVFAALVTGVTINPWWNVPQSIVEESVGQLTRVKPNEARRRGYVWDDGRFRQRPGPNNALGQIKLEMANPFHVYLHDTPNKALFDRPRRAFSHGCIRVGDALGLGSALLERSLASAVASGDTETFPLTTPLPVYVTYFTADASQSDTVDYHEDIYGRDGPLGDSHNPSFHCDT